MIPILHSVCFWFCHKMNVAPFVVGVRGHLAMIPVKIQISKFENSKLPHNKSLLRFSSIKTLDVNLFKS
jgi:hypothetical protein